MTITKTFFPRLKHARGISTRSLVEQVADPTRSDPVAEIETMFGDEKQVASTVAKLNGIIGGPMTDAQKLSAIFDFLTAAREAARQINLAKKNTVQQKPDQKVSDLAESASVELIESDVRILPGGRHVRIPGAAVASAAYRAAKAGVRLIRQSR